MLNQCSLRGGGQLKKQADFSLNVNCHDISSRTCEVWIYMKRSVKDDFCCEPIKPDQETLLASDLGSSERGFGTLLLKAFLARNSTAEAFSPACVLVELSRPLCVNVWVK